MKIPRDLSGWDLVEALKGLDYEVTRQTGSHIRLTTVKKGNHHITIPAHQSIRVGTLSAIFFDIARHFEMTKDDLLKTLFKK